MNLNRMRRPDEFRPRVANQNDRQDRVDSRQEVEETDFDSDNTVLADQQETPRGLEDALQSLQKTPDYLRYAGIKFAASRAFPLPQGATPTQIEAADAQRSKLEGVIRGAQKTGVLSFGVTKDRDLYQATVIDALNVIMTAHDKVQDRLKLAYTEELARAGLFGTRGKAVGRLASYVPEDLAKELLLVLKQKTPVEGADPKLPPALQALQAYRTDGQSAISKVWFEGRIDKLRRGVELFTKWTPNIKRDQVAAHALIGEWAKAQQKQERGEAQDGETPFDNTTLPDIVQGPRARRFFSGERIRARAIAYGQEKIETLIPKLPKGTRERIKANFSQNELSMLAEYWGLPWVRQQTVARFWSSREARRIEKRFEAEIAKIPVDAPPPPRELIVVEEPANDTAPLGQPAQGEFDLGKIAPPSQGGDRQEPGIERIRPAA